MAADKLSVKPRWGDLKTRLFAAAVLLPVVLFCIWAGGAAFSALLCLAGSIIVFEYASLVHSQRPVISLVLGFAGVIAAAFLPYFAQFGWWLVIVNALWLLDLIYHFNSAERSRNGYWPMLAFPYAVLPIAALAMIRAHPEYGLTVTVWIFLMIWCADTLAYFAGRLIGGPKLWPAVSPKKTWSGLGGAVCGAMLATWLVAGIWQPHLMLLPLLILAVFVGLISQAGDLFESALKRRFDAKDSSKLIPGHGGMLDRVDGLISASVALYALGAFRHGIGNAATGILSW